MFSRRAFLQTAVAVGAVRALPSFAAAPASGRIYIGTGNRGAGQGIMTATWNSVTGEIGPITLAAEAISPSFLAQHRRKDGTHLLYAVSEVSGPDATVSAYIADAATGALRLLNRVSSGGNGPTHLSVTGDGNTVLVANYGGGSASSFHVKEDGSLSEVVSHFQFTGSGANKARQGAPHTHSAMPSPDGRFALFNDLGLDRILVFHLNSATGEMTPADPPFWQAQPGTGPRHVAWSEDGRFLYSTNELDSTVEVLAWDSRKGTLRSEQHVTTLPADFARDKAFVGEIVLSPDGRNIYAGNRVADNTIAVFSVDRHTHLLKLEQLAPSGGVNSRHIALDPTGRWMVVSHQNSNDLTVLARDGKTGRLAENGKSYPTTKPMCVLFLSQ